METQGQVLIKILSVGDTQVGKSCLIKRYCEARFIDKYITTIGVDYGVKKMPILGKKTAINFFDLSGDDDYQEIRNPFFKDAQGIIMVFDLDNKQSFTNLSQWEKVMQDCGVDPKKSVIFLIGNKSDLKSKEIDSSEITSYAQQRGYQYIQTSAQNGDNVTQVFERLFTKVVEMVDQNRKALK